MACAPPATVATAGPDTAPPGPTIVGYRNVWNLQGEARQHPHRFQIDAVINYYDPVWRQLWGQDGDATFFLTPPAERLPIRSGQLVRITGVATPAHFANTTDLAVAVLAPHASVAAQPIRGRATDHRSFEERLVEVEGVVDSQTLVDPNHLRFLVVTEGTRIDAVLWLERGSPVPQLAGATVRVQGVYHAHLDTDQQLQSIELAVADAGQITVLGNPSPTDAARTAEAAIGPSGPADNVPVVGYRNFTNLQGAERDRPRAFQIDALVLYYDPLWRHLWAQDGDATFFVVTPAERLPIRAGQLVRLTGITTLSTFSQVAQLRATCLDPHPDLPVLRTAGRLAEWAALNERLVEIDGLVESQTLADANHLRCTIIAEGYRVETIVWLDGTTAAPSLAGVHVTIRGVYSGKLTPEGSLQSISLMVSGPQSIVARGLFREDPRFAGPGTPIETLPQASTGALFHASGRVVAVEPGVAVTLRDESGQLDVITPQEHGLRVGDRAQAVGIPAIGGGKWQLRQALVRTAENPGTPRATAPLQLRRLARQVLELTPQNAAANHPVRIQGVVTWSAPGARHLYLQDPSGGVRVEWLDASIAVPALGSGLLVQGHTTMAEFAPAVNATRFVNQYMMSAPEPRRLSLEEALSGTHEGIWAQMSGYLRAAHPAGAFTQLQLTTATGDFEALAPASQELAGHVGCFVALRGVCTAVTNAHHELTGIRLLVPTTAEITVVEAPPADLFALPENLIAGLRQYGPLQGFTHWLRTSGTVTYHVPGRMLIIQDGPEALTIYPTGDQPFQPGERIDTVGIHGRDGSRLVLRHAAVRRLGVTTPLVPFVLAAPSALNNDLDSRLVRIAGTLDEVTEIDGDTYLEVRHPDSAIIARLAGHTRPRDPWRTGSAIELTGIYRLKFDEHRQRAGFELLLRSPEDLVVVRQPPWWTPRRALAAAGLLGLGGALSGLWVVALRRKVRVQTEQIRQQIDKEAHLEAELERAQRVQSLGTLAGGIAHDFNNLLTVILGNLSLARLDQRVEALTGGALAEAESGAERARDLVQQMLTFARGGDPVRESFPLVPVVRETSALALSGSTVRVEIESPAELPPVFADRAQVRRALHNLLAHTVTAMPSGGIATIALAAEEVAVGHGTPLSPGRYLRIQITDHGTPIPAERLPSIFDPYAAAKDGASGDRFGLATAYSIAQKHGGHLTVRSQAGIGTTFTLWLPASSRPGASDSPAPSHPASAARPAKASRILFMDDEAGILRLGETLLRHLGHEPVTVADGAACLAAYRAAIAERRPFDLVIMDLTIPGGMGGRETIAELRKIDPLVRAIVSSGYADDPILARYREYGFVAVVPKPYEVDRLAAAVADALEESAAL